MAHSTVNDRPREQARQPRTRARKGLLDQLLPELAAQGRNGDTKMAHMTKGENVVPQSVAANLPGGQPALNAAYRKTGLNPGRYIVGGNDDSINPATGAREFFDSAGGVQGDPDDYGDDPADYGDFAPGPESQNDPAAGGNDEDRQGAYNQGPSTGSGGFGGGDSFESGGLLQAPIGEEITAVAPVDRRPVRLSDGAPTAETTPTPAPAPAPTAVPEDASVTTQLENFLASDSPLVTQARTRAAQDANRRGLLNSSLGVQAGEAAAYDVALPIASQQAAQIHQRNLAAIQERIAATNISAFDREKATAALVQLDNTYNSVFSTISTNETIPKEAREAYLIHAAALRDSNFNLVEQLYNIDLVWASPVG